MEEPEIKQNRRRWLLNTECSLLVYNFMKLIPLILLVLSYTNHVVAIRTRLNIKFPLVDKHWDWTLVKQSWCARAREGVAAAVAKTIFLREASVALFYDCFKPITNQAPISCNDYSTDQLN